MASDDLEQRAINVIRGLAMDGPQAAKNGHPGTAMALAPLAHVLFTRVMKYDPAAPDWPDRDRFILSAGHASILLYSMLHLTGHGLELEDIRQFRQWGSATPGHPEVHHTAGVEVTTGPLGQGFANAVGMGIAERWLRARFGPEVCDHHTYVICSDGDLMEGVTHEAASLAGHQGLGRLIYVYDDNHITIDGDTDLSFSDDTAKRFESYGWHVDDIGDVANDTDAIEAALVRAKEVEDRPSLVILRSHIGWPAPNKTDTASAHGEPLGDDEIRATKELLGLPVDETFHVPDDVLAFYRDTAGSRGRAAREAWEQRMAAWSGDRSELEACLRGRGYEGWAEKLPVWQVGDKVATRNASRDCIAAVADVVPGLLAGGADLTGNTGVALKGAAKLSKAEPGGRLLHYGIREHAMGAAMTGMALHGGVFPVGGTFLVFSDYMKPAVRLAAMSEAHVVYSWSHDSIGLGQDGPTHQPIEHLASLRAIPGLRVMRPADANETAHAWRVAVDGNGPTAMILTRQDLPILPGTAEAAEGVARGAYVLRPESQEYTHLVLVGTGSEVHVCLEAADLLEREDGMSVRVVSMPSWEQFEVQDDDYVNSVLGDGDVPVLAVEAASPFGWERWAQHTVTIDRFGASAPGDIVLKNLGFNAENVAQQARELVEEFNDDGLDDEED